MGFILGLIMFVLVLWFGGLFLLRIIAAFLGVDKHNKPGKHSDGY